MAGNNEIQASEHGTGMEMDWTSARCFFGVLVERDNSLLLAAALGIWVRGILTGTLSLFGKGWEEPYFREEQNIDREYCAYLTSGQNLLTMNGNGRGTMNFGLCIGEYHTGTTMPCDVKMAM